MEEIKPVNIPENPLNVLDRADVLAKRIEDANKKAEELLNKNEAVMARITLSGRSEAGQNIQAQEISPQDYARKVLNGEINPWIQKK